ncbi:MAG TPA: DedA family protein [Terriglobales bacterium]|jgi:membrane-associated protein
MAQHLLNLLQGYLVHYGYWAIAAGLLLENAGLPVPGETVLLLASFLAFSEHQLCLTYIIPVGIVAATLGDNLGYAIGHGGGRPLLERYHRVYRFPLRTLERGERLFERYGPATIFFARFIIGVRVIAGPLAGVLRMEWKRFALFNFLGATLWVTVISLAGYLFGSQWSLLIRMFKRLDAAIAIVVLLTAAFLWRRYRARSRPSGPSSNPQN